MIPPTALLIPAPHLVAERPGVLTLRADSPVTVESESLLPIAELLVDKLQRSTGIQLTAPTTGPNIGGGIHLDVDPTSQTIAGIPPARGVAPDGSLLGAERFAIDIDSGGARLVGASLSGLHHAATVIHALAEQSPQHTEDIVLPSVCIADGPALAWRGLSLDLVRHEFLLDEVLRVVDLVERYRMNVLHLHMTDEQGWRLRIPSRPALTPAGTTFFTAADYTAIVDYAGVRRITVIPEIDMPGHCGAAIAAYPELCRSGIAQPVIVDPMEAIARIASNDFEPQFLDPDKDAVWAFVDDVIGAVAALTPGPYVHIGGDEAFGMPQQLHDAFVTRARTVVRGNGKEPIGWQEAARAEATPGELLQLWIGQSTIPEPDVNPFAQMLPPQLLEMLATTFADAAEDPRRMAEKNARVIMSRTDLAYLDTPYAETTTIPDVEARRERLGLPAYPAVTIEQVATARIPGLDADTDLDVIGFEAAIWCETVRSFDDLTFLLLPRLPVLAQRVWEGGPAQDWADLRRRLAAQAPVWRRDNITFFPSPSVYEQ